MNYLVPIVIIMTVIASIVKKISLYDSFVEGVKEALRLTITLMPFVISVFILIELFEKSGLNDRLSKLLEIPLSYIGIPKELIGLIIVRPLSGSASLASLESILSTYGPDSYVGKCASVICGANDTILYIVAVYTANVKNKKIAISIPISIFASFLGVIVACFLCRFL